MHLLGAFKNHFPARRAPQRLAAGDHYRAQQLN
jgi:hypothetical protein